MNTSWPTMKLSGIVREEHDRIGVFDGAGLPVLGVTNLEGVTQTGVEASDDRSKYLRVRPGRFVYNPYRINVGSIGLSADSEEGICSPAYVVFAPTEQIDARYLFYFLKSARGSQLINFHGNRGSVRSALRFHDLSQIEIPLPPVAEQRRIVARIEDMSAKIEQARERRKHAAAEIEALWAASLRAELIRCKCEEIPLEAVCVAIIDNLHSNPQYADTGIPCVRSPDVGWGTLKLERALKTDEAEYRRRTVRGEPQPDDIVLVREGGGTGKTAIVLPNQRFSLGQRVMLLRSDKERVLPKFFLNQLLSPLIQEDQIGRLCKGSAAPHLNIGALRKFPLRVPPLAEQRRIVAYLDDLQKQTEALRLLQAETSAELNALMPSILDKAFRGKL